MQKIKVKQIFIAVITMAVLSCLLLAGCGSLTAPITTGEFDSSQEINVISREGGSGTRVAFIDLLDIEEKGDDGTSKDRTTKEAIITNKTDVMLINTAGNAYAVGYVSMGSLNDKVKTLSIDGVSPTTENVHNGSYKLTRIFYIAIKGEASGLTKDFIDFILSSDGQAVVDINYISVNANAAAFVSSRPTGKIVVAGSSSVTPVMEKLREAYLEINPDADIEVQQSDSTAGISGLMEGTCDIGMSSRALKEEELGQLTAIPIALDGIAIIVNNANPCTNISSIQARDIFTGDILYWRQAI
jgi:phosphate transport system substrate-binding protein